MKPLLLRVEEKNGDPKETFFGEFLGGRNNPDNPDDPEAPAAMDGMDDTAVTLDHHAERDEIDFRKGRSAVQSCHLRETLR